MDRTLLYLEGDEEIPSVIERLKAEKAEVVTLVVPKASIVLQSVINLKLLLRVAKEHKKTIALVSHDPIGRNLAAQVGIAAYDSINAKTPILEPRPREVDPDEIIEINRSEEKSPGVTVHHFQDSEPKEPETEVPFEDPTPIVAADFTTEPIDTSPSDDLPEVIVPAARPEPPPKKIKSGRRRGGLIIGLVSALVVIGLGLFIFYPKATIALSVPGEPFEGDVDITAKTSQKDVDLTAGTIPAQSFEVIKEKSEKISATGKKDIGQKAKGTIEFDNGWSTDPQQFPSGTSLTKDGKKFLTTSDITIPGATLALKEGQVVTNPGKTTGGIEASDAGDSFNVGAGKFTFSELTGERQAKIYGQSTAALQGGSSKEIKVVSQSDIENAKDKIEGDILTDAKKELQDQAKGLILLDKGIKVETIDMKPSAAAGTEANDFNLSIKAKARGLAFSNTAFRDVFLSKINEKINKDKELILVDKDEVVTSIKDVNFTDQTEVINGAIKAKLGPKFDREGLKTSVTGKSINEAKGKVKAATGTDNATITVKPNWLLGRLPFSARQIDIKIDYQ